jgi:hypothetical protein
LVEVAVRWHRTQTEATAEEAISNADAISGLARMVVLTDNIDHRLERGVRVIALYNPDIAAIVEASDRRREEVMVELLTRAYVLKIDEATSASRLFHALHQTAVMRSPNDIKGYTRAAIAHLVDWLPKAGPHRLPENLIQTERLPE